MSHLLDFETCITDCEALVRALSRMGFTKQQIEIHDKAVAMRGYHSEDQKVANVIVRQEHTKIPSDIGFRLNEKTGNYVSIVDNYHYSCSPHYNNVWLEKLYTHYNVEKTKMLLTSRGMSFIEALDKSGEIQLTVQTQQPQKMKVSF